MKLESISQEILPAPDSVMTTVVVSEVASYCILARQMIEILGRPGVDSDMEMVGTDDTWTIAWTKPHLTLENTTRLLQQNIIAQQEPIKLDLRHFSV